MLVKSIFHFKHLKIIAFVEDYIDSKIYKIFLFSLAIYIYQIVKW